MKRSIKNLARIVLMVLAIAIGNISNTQAQSENHKKQGPPPLPSEEQIKERVGNLSKQLALTADQETKILELFTAHFKQERVKRNEHEAARLNFEKQLKTLLTEEQQKQFDDFQKQHKPPVNKPIK